MKRVQAKVRLNLWSFLSRRFANSVSVIVMRFCKLKQQVAASVNWGSVDRYTQNGKQDGKRWTQQCTVAFEKSLLPWKSDTYCIFWVYVCAIVIQDAIRMRPITLPSVAFLFLQCFSTLSNKLHHFRVKRFIGDSIFFLTSVCNMFHSKFNET
jgi:hypothetical protein